MSFVFPRRSKRYCQSRKKFFFYFFFIRQIVFSLVVCQARWQVYAQVVKSESLGGITRQVRIIIYVRSISAKSLWFYDLFTGI